MNVRPKKNVTGFLSASARYPQPMPGPATGFKKLTPREKDVLDQLAMGFRYKEIVDNLGISIGTLNGYICNVYEKLEVHSRTEAVVKHLVRQPEN
ncbi:MAG TPA: LuxR C-terminal-related transcriptional regulator [Candidatus Acidoferrales bacterium]|jgi:DNA-binding NarL/FixJ family response regulator|nr:LuxR C-terminal-related transcriptional regulator [Candidatus Acidoferrales bacterium]